TIEIQVAGRGTIPTDATAALLNIGLVAPDGPGYATLYPCGTRPTTSNVNTMTAGTVRANHALTKLSPTGTVCIYVKTATDLTIEIQVAGRGTIPTDATAALLNIGLVAPDGPGYATLYPCGTRPTTSNVNTMTAGTVRANNALTKLSPTGTVCIYVKTATDL